MAGIIGALYDIATRLGRLEGQVDALNRLVETKVVTETVVVTKTLTITGATPPVPPIPGFPLESIIAGLLLRRMSIRSELPLMFLVPEELD